MLQISLTHWSPGLGFELLRILITSNGHVGGGSAYNDCYQEDDSQEPLDTDDDDSKGGCHNSTKSELGIECC